MMHQVTLVTWHQPQTRDSQQTTTKCNKIQKTMSTSNFDPFYHKKNNKPPEHRTPN
uniref:Uncharacterized protein n=1 Tax=Rhizophora mucronata TaxID=61149 RepID=A0A2P2QZF6_RHIMU